MSIRINYSFEASIPTTFPSILTFIQSREAFRAAKEVSRILEINYETDRIYLKDFSSKDLVNKTDHGNTISEYATSLLGDRIVLHATR